METTVHCNSGLSFPLTGVWGHSWAALAPSWWITHKHTHTNSNWQAGKAAFPFMLPAEGERRACVRETRREGRGEKLPFNEELWEELIVHQLFRENNTDQSHWRNKTWCPHSGMFSEKNINQWAVYCSHFVVFQERWPAHSQWSIYITDCPIWGVGSTQTHSLLLQLDIY